MINIHFKSLIQEPGINCGAYVEEEYGGRSLFLIIDNNRLEVDRSFIDVINRYHFGQYLIERELKDL